jgi:hypothetical protein
MSTRLNVLLLGGCLIHWPLTVVSRINPRFDFDRYGTVRPLHTFGEMFQTLDILDGKKTVPPELIHLTRLSRGMVATPAANGFADLDLALVEPASPIELLFRDITINRMRIHNYVRMGLAKEDEEGLKLLTAWFREGLGRLKDDVRADAAAKLVDHIGGDSETDELRRAVVRETRAEKADVVDGFRKVRDRLGCPIGAVVYVFSYMPDGRIVTWPPGFRQEVLAAAQALALPTFEPDPLVQSFGVEAAMLRGRHYSEAFSPIIGEALAEFAEQVHRGAAAKKAASH